MKKVLFTLLCFSLFVGCQLSQKPRIMLPDSVRKVSILEIGPSLPEYIVWEDSLILDEDFEQVVGLIEMDAKFDMHIVKRQGYKGKYMYGKASAPDWVREAVILTIDSFPADSQLVDLKPDIYDGCHYFVQIEKQDGQKILLGGYPKCVSYEIRELSYYTCDSVDHYVNKEIQNQDSLRSRLRQYKGMIALPPPPPLPIKKIKVDIQTLFKNGI